MPQQIAATFADAIRMKWTNNIHDRFPVSRGPNDYEGRGGKNEVVVPPLRHIYGPQQLRRKSV